MDQAKVAAAKEIEKFNRQANTPSNRQRIDQAKKRLSKLSALEK
jgi:hypothetical protein